MKLKNKFTLIAASLAIVTLPIVSLASCTKPSESDTKPDQQPSKPDNEVKPPVNYETTIIQENISKDIFLFAGTVQENAYKINKSWVLQNKDKLLNGTILLENENDIIDLDAFPNSVDNTKMTIEFSIISGKWVDENNNIGSENKMFKIDIENFEQPTLTLETLSHLLKNYISPFVKPKKYELQENKVINKTGSYNGPVISDWLTIKTNSTWETKGERTLNGERLGPVVYPTQNETTSTSFENSLIFSKKDFNESVVEFLNKKLKKFGYIQENHNVINVNLYWEYALLPNTFNSIISCRLRPMHFGFNVKNENDEFIYTINNNINIAPISEMAEGFNYIPRSFAFNDNDILIVKILKTDSGTQGEEIENPITK